MYIYIYQGIGSIYVVSPFSKTIIVNGVTE